MGSSKAEPPAAYFVSIDPVSILSLTFTTKDEMPTFEASWQGTSGLSTSMEAKLSLGTIGRVMLRVLTMPNELDGIFFSEKFVREKLPCG